MASDQRWPPAAHAIVPLPAEVDCASASSVSAQLDAAQDYWLLDDEHVLIMRYDSAGRLLGGEPLPPAQAGRYLRSREAALAHAVPFGAYWAAHPQFWRRNWLVPGGAR